MDYDILIIGTDINAYYMARCYHERFNKKANIIGKERMAFTSFSNITNVIIEPNLWDQKVFLKTLTDYYKDSVNKNIILVGTNDFYVRLIIENKKKLEEYYLFNYPNEDILNGFMLKELFYTKYKDYNIDIPKTIIYDIKRDDDLKIDFEYPLILKNSDGIDYYKHKFLDMNKVYKIKNKKELNEIVSKIKNSGYSGNLIIQEYIPGNDDKLYDCVVYGGKDKKVKLISFAQVALQEWTKTAVGNTTVLLNGYNDNDESKIIIDKIIKFLNEIGYQGFAVIDLKYDTRDKKYKILEINVRQGRASYYINLAGFNLVDYLYRDLVLKEKLKLDIIKEKVGISFVPNIIIKKYVRNKKLVDEVLKLRLKNKIINPLKYKKDKNFKRKVYLFLRSIKYIKKYKNNRW